LLKEFRLLQVSREDVVGAPFPHVISREILPPAIFEALKADFPTAARFDDQKSRSGTEGSRTGSGFDIYRGDSGFDDLVKRSEAWAAFHGYINSEAFADTFRNVFADHLSTIGLKIDIGGSRVDTNYAEPRAVMRETASLKDKVKSAASRVMSPFSQAKPVTLFTRLDVHKSLAGYAKPPHCDRPNRLCSLIVYFSDAKESGIKGGDLSIFRHKQAKPVTRYERHPKTADVDCVATLTPAPNLGVFFPCQNNSYHGVSQITSQGIERDFLYINISGHKASLWG
jgi:hypothetical protein